MDHGGMRIGDATLMDLIKEQQDEIRSQCDMIRRLVEVIVMLRAGNAEEKRVCGRHAAKETV